MGGLRVFALGAACGLRSRGRRLGAGAALAILWMKPTLALPVALALLLLGEVGLLAGLLLGGVGILLASLLASSGPDAWTAYLHRVSDPGDLLGDFWILWRRQATLRTFFAGFSNGNLGQLVLGWVGTAVGVVGAISAAWLGRRTARIHTDAADLHAGAVISWCLLAAPHLLEYDLGMHLVGWVASFGWLAAGRARYPRAGAVLLGFAWLAGAFVLVNKSAHVNLTALSIALWASWMLAELDVWTAISGIASPPCPTRCGRAPSTATPRDPALSPRPSA